MACISIIYLEDKDTLLYNEEISGRNIGWIQKLYWYENGLLFTDKETDQGLSRQEKNHDFSHRGRNNVEVNR